MKDLNTPLPAGYIEPMTTPMPDWLEPATYIEPNPHVAPPMPDWLSSLPIEPKQNGNTLPNTEEGRALMIAQFEMVFPRILEMVCEGYHLDKAARELPIKIHVGAFMRWLKKDPQRFELYKEAREVRTEVWSGEMVKHALGEGTGAEGEMALHEVARSKLIVETYWKLMGAHDRKQYGDVKTLEVNQSISITAALDQARARVSSFIDVTAEEVELPMPKYEQLIAAQNEEDDDE